MMLDYLSNFKPHLFYFIFWIFTIFFQNIYKNEGQNWVTTLNIVGSMLKTKEVANEFWADVIDCVVYLSNRCPIKILNDMNL
jgi:hypothetical protein